MADYWQEKLQKMHRRAQRAEGALGRIELWLSFHEKGFARRRPAIRERMAVYYLRQIRSEMNRFHPNTQTEQERP